MRVSGASSLHQARHCGDRRRLVELLALLSLGGCAVPPGGLDQPATPGTARDPGIPDPSTPSHRPQGTDLSRARWQVPRFSDGSPGEPLPASWEPYVLAKNKKPTDYRFARDAASGKTVLRASAQEKSATGLYCRLAPLPEHLPDRVTWSWKADGVAPDADVTDTYADDSPGRIILAFDGDAQEFGFRDRLFFEQVRAFTGIDLPYATLIYVWDPRLPVGTVVKIPQTTRIRYIVVETGLQSQGRWLAYDRDIADDYVKAFSARVRPLVALGLMTDTDDFGMPAQADYGDIVLTWQPPPPSAQRP